MKRDVVLGVSLAGLSVVVCAVLYRWLDNDDLGDATLEVFKLFLITGLVGGVVLVYRSVKGADVAAERDTLRLEEYRQKTLRAFHALQRARRLLILNSSADGDLLVFNARVWRLVEDLCDAQLMVEDLRREPTRDGRAYCGLNFSSELKGIDEFIRQVLREFEGKLETNERRLRIRDVPYISEFLLSGEKPEYAVAMASMHRLLRDVLERRA
ncbi:AtpZ/AtpI family protein [Afifella sp. IM 167]|uniref:AtpZ/AtpI family protein n=1 Tax=Afifella sp. IM 167 TaxID=2033586 RepID=UPI001CD0337F|nr:AtpZ/AtpI family protein [Afifella sp. IM 167]MBZ8135497.1 hypothetical protein [Afifella sp. IM 167]